MSQFTSTEHANEAFREALTEYQANKLRLKDIKTRSAKGEPISDIDIQWLCNSLEFAITQQESSWYDH